MNLGKYGNQEGLYNFYYGLTTTGAVNTSDFGEGYFNSFARTLSNVIIEYYYYDGLNWIFETEEIGGNSKEWYTTYVDNLGNKFLQNRFELPLFLVPYTKSYVLSLEKNESQWAINQSINTNMVSKFMRMMRLMDGDARNKSIMCDSDTHLTSIMNKLAIMDNRGDNASYPGYGAGTTSIMCPHTIKNKISF